MRCKKKNLNFLMGIETERFNTHSLLAIRRSFLEFSKLEVPIWHL
jgi:hypothetical protein